MVENMDKWLATLAITARGERAQELFEARRDMATTNAMETVAIQVLSLPIPEGDHCGMVIVSEAFSDENHLVPSGRLVMGTCP